MLRVSDIRFMRVPIWSMSVFITCFSSVRQFADRVMLSLVEQCLVVVFQLVLGLSERRSLLAGSVLLLYFAPAVVGRVFVEVVCVLYNLCSWLDDFHCK